MVSRAELTVWKKILGNQVESFTTTGVNYCIFFGKEGWECDCMDFKIRKGSHTFEVTEEGDKKVRIQTCKHIGQFLADSGAEVYETHGWYGSKSKIEPRKK